MINKLRALVGGVALLLVLAACFPPGISSQAAQGYEIQATITKGNVDLTHDVWDDGVYGGGFLGVHGLQGNYSYYRSEYEGNGRAKVDLNFLYSKGNWQVSGKWLDGRVRMEFTGRSEYLSALLSACLSNFDFWCNSGDWWYYEVQGYTWAYDFGGNDCGWFETPPAPGYIDDITVTDWVKGGCTYIPTMYRSLNSDYVGTGHALILVCQNGSGPLTEMWENPSYIEVWIPDTTWISQQFIGDFDVDIYGDDTWDEYSFYASFDDNVYYTQGYFQNDNSPFRNYYAGGVNTNRSGKWIVQSKLNLMAVSPLPTEPQIFDSYEWFLP